MLISGRSCALEARALIVTLSIAILAPLPAIASAFSTYGAAYRPFELPAVRAGSFTTVADALPDGRLVAATGASLFIETAPKSGLFALGAVLDGALLGGPLDPAFLRVSPGGAKIALGAGFGKPLLVFNAALVNSGAPANIDASSASAFDVAHFSAAWADDARLAIASGDFGAPAIVSLLDTTSSPAAPVNPTIIANIGGASAGVAFDAMGRLYTGNGFDNGPGGSETGWIKAFEPSLWSAGQAADFESAGVLISDILSASALTFDHEGNLFVGGGDFSSGDTGSLAIVRASALQLALAGAGPIDAFDPLLVRRLDPRADGFGFYGVAFNGATGELYVTDGVAWHATIPAPGAGWVGAAVLAARIARRRVRNAA